MTFYFSLAGILSVLFLCFKARAIGEALGLMDRPLAEAHKFHTEPTPLIGAVLVGTALGFLVLENALTQGGGALVWISLAALIMGVLGAVDDRLKLTWSMRFVALWLIVGGLLYAVPALGLSELRWSWGQTTELGLIGGMAFTALCLVGLVIALNMMDGYNGGVLSQCGIWTLIFAFLASNTNQTIYLYLAAMVAVIMAFNLRGKLFLGDGGAYALGILMGASAIFTYTSSSAPVYADTIVVWLALPVFDCLRVIFSRKLRGESPFLPQRDHLHHILIRVGGQKLALLFAVCFGGTFGILSIVVPQHSFWLVMSQLLVIAVTVAGLQRYRGPKPLPAE